MDSLTIASTISWALIVVQLIAIVCTLLIGFRNTRRLIAWSKKKYALFADRQIKMLEGFEKRSRERLDLLSRENARLMEENEMLREKLKNLGFSDTHLDN